MENEQTYFTGMQKTTGLATPEEPQLNAAQLEAVTTTEGFVRVIAGAGTGKTRALTHRFAYLVNDLGILPGNILCVTFSNKAANEMRQRIRRVTGDNDTGYICTFHSFCVSVLQEDSHAVGYPQSFLVLDNADIDAMLQVIYEERKITLREKTFGKARDMIEMLKTVQRPDYYVDLISLPLAELKQKYLDARSVDDIIFYGYLYQQKKCFGLDYNDLIIITLHIFDHFPDIALKWQQRLEYVMIDEFQDIDALQIALMEKLVEYHRNLFVVGDPDQTIYTWRGADVRYLLDFADAHEGCKTILMTENYRSTQHVVAFANAFVKGIHNRMKQTPILSMSKDEGTVVVTHHASHIMFQRVVSDLLRQRNSGTISVLTHTNEEAVILVALLRRHGLRSKLIQSMDGFRFWNMAEVRLFLKYIERDTHTPIVTDEVWNEAKRKTFQAYATSSSLPYLKRCIELFEKINKAKYLTDFKELVFESTTEDFCDTSDADVVVSTIHKSKGCEFDDVYMLVSQPQHVTDSEMRSYYVGMTRARKRLFIYTNSTLFDRLPADIHQVDQTPYVFPDEVMLQLSHKDVNLGFFKSRKKEILSLRSGEKLCFANNLLYVPNNQQPVAQLSQKMQAELAQWALKGYLVSSATIRFIVAWKPKDAPKDEKEYAVLLLDLELKKTTNTQK